MIETLVRESKPNSITLQGSKDVCIVCVSQPFEPCMHPFTQIDWINIFFYRDEETHDSNVILFSPVLDIKLWTCSMRMKTCLLITFHQL